MMERETLETPAPTESTVTLPSPVGRLGLTARGERIVGLGFAALPAAGEAQEVLGRAAVQLAEYFSRDRDRFELPLAPPTEGLLGRVLHALAEVPHGETVSYKELTLAAGFDTERVRDVGAALGRNPIAILIPCHRVIGANGSLVGFGGGLARKRRLLDLEAPQLQLCA
jgi:methylated-DNA-[protein]-cysteine S-methyltransferase